MTLPTTAKQKLEKLSHSWYGYAVCATLFSVFGLRASGLVSLAIGFVVWAVICAIGLAISLAMMAFFSSRLQAGSAAMRSFLLFVSGLFTVLGVLSFLGEGRLFLQVWNLSILLQMAATGVSVWMYARSFAVLTDKQVRTFFA